MISEVEHKKKLVVEAGIKRFFSEGYVLWSEYNIKKLFGGELSDADIRLLKDWEKKGFIAIKKNKDCFIEVLKIRE